MAGKHRAYVAGDIVIANVGYQQYTARILEIKGDKVVAVRQEPRANQYAEFVDAQARVEFTLAHILTLAQVAPSI